MYLDRSGCAEALEIASDALQEQPVKMKHICPSNARGF